VSVSRTSNAVSKYAEFAQFPIAGRISAVVPFLPFTAEEQAVIAHKYVLELAKNVRLPPALPVRLMGSIVLRVPRDASVCMSLAEGYDVDTGAPSLQSTIASRVRRALVLRYLEENEEVHENQRLEEYLIDVDVNGQIVIFRSLPDKAGVIA
jgi:ATP-dependent Clp protease ATP-binding subunit ClpA